MIGSVSDHVALGEPKALFPGTDAEGKTALFLAGNIKEYVSCRGWQLSFFLSCREEPYCSGR